MFYWNSPNEMIKQWATIYLQVLALSKDVDQFSEGFDVLILAFTSNQVICSAKQKFYFDFPSQIEDTLRHFIGLFLDKNLKGYSRQSKEQDFYLSFAVQVVGRFTVTHVSAFAKSATHLLQVFIQLWKEIKTSLGYFFYSTCKEII